MADGRDEGEGIGRAGVRSAAVVISVCADEGLPSALSETETPKKSLAAASLACNFACWMAANNGFGMASGADDAAVAGLGGAAACRCAPTRGVWMITMDSSSAVTMTYAPQGRKRLRIVRPLLHWLTG